ncbi:hypothetical protein FOL47_007635 [Perkinsus chesapeaki]|uniref:Uncharacterized protein n=1 Tax=Perkinsus chesapeaki TaxID=330153 RepID=A0A7J6LJ40_PERCH|nr:hypothetical protein FOL47_007635 [Perkinsus chesapeaki]
MPRNSTVWIRAISTAGRKGGRLNLVWSILIKVPLLRSILGAILSALAFWQIYGEIKRHVKSDGSIGGPPNMIFVLLTNPDPLSWRSTAAALNVVVHVFTRLPVLLAGSLLDNIDLWTVLALNLGAVCGLVLGNRISRYVSPSLFRASIDVFLLISSFMMTPMYIFIPILAVAVILMFIGLSWTKCLLGFVVPHEYCDGSVVTGAVHVAVLSPIMAAIQFIKLWRTADLWLTIYLTIPAIVFSIPSTMLLDTWKHEVGLLRATLGTLLSVSSICQAAADVKEYIDRKENDSPKARQPWNLGPDGKLAPKIWASVTGAASGVMTGLFSIGGPPMMVWVLLAEPDPTTWRGTSALIFTGVTFFRRAVIFTLLASSIFMLHTVLRIISSAVCFVTTVILLARRFVSFRNDVEATEDEIALPVEVIGKPIEDSEAGRQSTINTTTPTAAAATANTFTPTTTTTTTDPTSTATTTTPSTTTTGTTAEAEEEVLADEDASSSSTQRKRAAPRAPPEDLRKPGYASDNDDYEESDDSKASSDPQILQPLKAQRNRRRHSDFSTMRRRSSGFSGGGAGSLICHQVEVSRTRGSSSLAVSEYKDAGYWQTVVSFTGLAMCILQGGYKSATTLTSGLSGSVGIAGSVIVFSCIFFTLLQLQGVLLIPMAIIALKTSPEAEWRVPLFWAMAMLPLASGFVFLMVPPVPKSDIIPGAPEPVTSPLDTLLFGLREKDMLCLIPGCITNGMVVGYVFGGFSRYLVAPILGVRTAVAAQSIFFIFNAIFSHFWGRLITTRRLGRGMAYFFATVAQLTFFITVISLHLLQTWLSSNFTPNPSGDGMLQWVQIDTPTSAEYWTIVGLILLLAFGDSLYEFELPAKIQARFAPTRYHLVAISNYKAYQSFGYFIQFTIDLILGDEQLNSFYRGGMVHPSLILISVGCFD